MYYPTLLEKREPFLKCRSISSEAMCVADLQADSYPSMKNILQWLPRHERPVALVEMMPRSVEGWRGTAA